LFIINHFYIHHSLWGWLKLLVVPAVIAGGGLWFNAQQRDREQRTANERAQDEALQAYLDQMSSMLIPNTDQPSLYKARPGDSLSSVARARTLTVLPRLDGGRKARVVQFLYESGLIAKDHLILDLHSADLSYANLRGAQLSFANLSSKADLSSANLSEAVLREAKLSFANLRDANLRDADLFQAILRCADLSYADLSYDADLKSADLSGANLSGTNLSEVDLSGADLSGADLSGAYLTGVKGQTHALLEAQAKSLEHATMPNGQKYEDWLKDKKAQGKDEKN
jgi:uncharacterized protein YjbI with pentapeptide repeats